MSGNVININDFDYNIIKCAKILSRPKGKHKPKKSKIYRDLVCAFDIETTRLKDINQSFMYIKLMNTIQLLVERGTSF